MEFSSLFCGTEFVYVNRLRCAHAALVWRGLDGLAHTGGRGGVGYLALHAGPFEERDSRRIYPHPDTLAVAAFKNNADKIYFFIFSGTWCEDSQFIIPKFFRIQEASGFPENRITLFAVDRAKTTTGSIAQAMNINYTVAEGRKIKYSSGELPLDLRDEVRRLISPDVALWIEALDVALGASSNESK